MAVVDWRRAVLLLAFPVPFLLFITNTAPASRYLNPVLPFMALFAAWLLARAASRASATVGGVLGGGHRRRFARRPGERADDLFFRQDDTRTLARRYIESQHPGRHGHPDSAVLRAADHVAAALEEALTFHLGGAAAASDGSNCNWG